MYGLEIIMYVQPCVMQIYLLNVALNTKSNLNLNLNSNSNSKLRNLDSKSKLEITIDFSVLSNEV